MTFLRIRKPIAWIPAILMMAFIISFSGEDGEESESLSLTVTKNIVTTIGRIPFVDMNEERKEEWTSTLHLPVRKTAHMSEYALLSVFILLPLTLYRISNKKKYLITLVFCFLFACSDEIHQLFVDGRSGLFTDVLFDTAGAALGILFWFAVSILYFRRRQPPIL